MDNIILAGMLDNFADRHGCKEDTTDVQFEKFINYCLLSSDYYDSFEFEKVETGRAFGVDGAAVVIGGVIVQEVEDAIAFTKAKFDAKFVFTQAKTSTSFDLGDFLKFVSAIKLFFGKDRAAIPEEIRKAYDIKEVIYQKAAKLRELPVLEICYAYTGRFGTEKASLIPAVKAEVAELRSMPYMFSEVTWNVYDGDSIARLYREAQNDIHAEVPFQRHVALPPISGASTAYIGVVKCLDYVKLIGKESGELNKGLFYENVRDYLGQRNPVNQDIAATIRSTDQRGQFAILNNGVTIVARSVTPSGDFFKISQFQIVNGCQTSHVLFRDRKALTDDMYITVKLIETSDIDLASRIITTTNSQSHVTKEAFATIRPYHKSIEDFFAAMRGAGYAFYYERQPHQYDDRDDVRQSQIVSVPTLIKSFISVVHEEPHKVHYYYGRLLEEYSRNKSSELFADTDYPGLYFAAHLISEKTRAAIGKDRALSIWSFHLALLVRKQIAPELSKGIRLNDRRFLDIIARIEAQFDSAYETARKILTRAKVNSNQNRLPETTKALVIRLFKDVSKLNEEVVATRAPRPVTLRDGQYIGMVESLDMDNSRVAIKYGPYTLLVDAPLARIGDMHPGERIGFAIAGTAIEVAMSQELSSEA